MKAESWLHTDGHSRILRVSDWSDSASLTRSISGSADAVTQDTVVARDRFRYGGGVFKMRRLWPSFMDGQPQDLNFYSYPKEIGGKFL